MPPIRCASRSICYLFNRANKPTTASTIHANWSTGLHFEPHAHGLPPAHKLLLFWIDTREKSHILVLLAFVFSPSISIVNIVFVLQLVFDAQRHRLNTEQSTEYAQSHQRINNESNVCAYTPAAISVKYLSLRTFAKVHSIWVSSKLSGIRSPLDNRRWLTYSTYLYHDFEGSRDIFEMHFSRNQYLWLWLVQFDRAIEFDIDAVWRKNPRREYVTDKCRTHRSANCKGIRMTQSQSERRSGLANVKTIKMNAKEARLVCDVSVCVRSIAFAHSIISRRVYDLRIKSHTHTDRQASYGELQLLRSKLVSNSGVLITPILKSQSSLSFRLQPLTENIDNLRIPWSIQRYERNAQPVLDSSHTLECIH